MVFSMAGENGVVGSKISMYMSSKNWLVNLQGVAKHSCRRLQQNEFLLYLVYYLYQKPPHKLFI